MAPSEVEVERLDVVGQRAVDRIELARAEEGLELIRDVERDGGLDLEQFIDGPVELACPQGWRRSPDRRVGP